jgi:phosphatidate cytidylyltransferase
MLKRTITGAAIAVVFIGVLLLGEIVDRSIMSAFLYVVVAVCILEVRHALGERIPKEYNWIIWLYAALYGLPYFYFGFRGIMFLTILCFILACFVGISHNHPINVLAYVAFLFVYPGILFSTLLYINRSASTRVITPDESVYQLLDSSLWRGEQLLPYNTVGLSLVFAVSWFTDTGAYIFGTAFGKHKLCPHISPKKTVEGAIGGIFGGLLGSAFIFVLFELNILNLSITGLPVRMSLKILDYVLIGFFGAILTQLGDLFASLVKRYCGIKDYSNLLGSHGGFMDRFDGIVFNACFVAAIYTFIL